jgi:hypothetical protein
MSRTSKSPRAVALEALATARRALPSYSSRFSRHDFTLAQHFACLVLKSFFRTDYRGIAAILQDLPDLCAALELAKVPHFTTLQKAHGRILAFGPFSQLLDVTVRRALGERPRVELAAGDSTGVEASQISPYFVTRRGPRGDAVQGTSYTRYPKLELLCDCRTHVVLSAIPTLGPRPDTDRLRPLLFPALSRGVGIACGLFDAGYDSEPNHVFARQCCHVRSVIPAQVGRPRKDPATTPPRGRWRRVMTARRDFRYGQRWQAERVVSMIKRRQGGYVLGRSDAARDREMSLKVLAHNVMLNAEAA